MLCERTRGADCEVTKHKGLYFVRGDIQMYMDDYLEVWAPIARYSTLRVFLEFCSCRGLEMEQMDVATVVLNGDVETEIHIPQPRGYTRGARGKVCKLKIAIYGFKQAAQAWYRKLKEMLGGSGFTAYDEEPCLFVGKAGAALCLILVYVEDLLVAGQSARAANGGLRVISEAFKARELVSLAYFLRLHIELDEAAKVLRAHQRQYVLTLMERYGVANAHPVRLPMGVGIKMQKAGTLLTVELVKVYRELFGALLYLCTETKPEIAYAVGRLTRYVSEPTVDHLSAARVVLRYMKRTRFLGICFQTDGELQSYGDADFAADVDTRRSTSVLFFIYSGGAVVWGSKVQPTVAASKTEAEYIASAVTAKEAVWLCRLCGFLTGRMLPVTIRCDNQSALAMTLNPVSSARTKHFDICHHSVRESVV